MFAQQPQPDFHRFVDVLWRREPDRVPIAEMGIDLSIKERVLGKPVRQRQGGRRVLVAPGYDYIYLRPLMNSLVPCLR